MKKIRIFTLLIVMFLTSTSSVNAVTRYVQGIVKSSSSVYTDNNMKTRVYNDTGYAISLSKPEAVEILSEEENSYQIKFLYSGFLYTGYISKNAVSSKEYITDDNYENELISIGFPSEYAKKLAILHAIHPNWNFIPSFTGKVDGGMDFYTAVDKEAEVVSRNLIDSANTSLRSTADGAYQNGNWIGLSGSNWFAASRQTIAFFMDTRNFLDESHIFMFENLGYNPTTQTAEVVNKIIGSSFMQNPFTCFETSKSCPVGQHNFVDSFIQAGIDKSVSPVHLATRAIQEQGSSGSVLSLGTGYNGQYIGYYNFFNINASGKTDYDVIINGLTYAFNRNWNNQHVSIYEGSSTIASNYIKIGQSTLYYQKFNTILLNYDHQFQQNIKAPYSEGYNTYSNYYKSYLTTDEWNNATYEFLIPVYQNMGNPTTLDTSGNEDATLRLLSVSSCRLNPDFQSSAYNYDCYVSTDINEVNVNASATNSLAKVTYDEHVILNENDVTIKIVVTAANGNTSDYYVNIHKIETDGYSPGEILNGIGSKTNGSYVSNIEVGMDVSNIINSVLNKYHFAKITIMDSLSNAQYSGIIKTGYKISINNAGITGYYTVVLYGDTTGDGVIDIRDLLVIQKHLVKAKTLSDEYLVSSDINKDGSVDIRDLLLEQKYLLNQYSISQG